MKLTYGSLFAGVGGFDQGFDASGMQCLWQCEWDKSCQKLLAAKWPNSKHYGDITKIRAGDLDVVDAVCGGSPCQNLSVAGLREGLAGDRSGLFFDMVRICKNQRRRGGARVVVWENVDGAFSSNGGRDFAAVLRAFTGMAVEVPAGGWGRAGFIKTPFPAWRWHCAWRVFDAQYFGVPQRRRRVFLVASAGDGSCAEILFESESLRGDSPPSREPGQKVTGTISARTEGGGGLGTDFEIGGGCSKSLKASDGGIDREDGHTLITIGPDAGKTFDFDAQAFKPSHFTRGKDGAPSNLVPPLSADADKGDQEPLVLSIRGRGDSCNLETRQDGTANSLLTPSGGRAGVGVGAIAHNMAVRRLTPKECERLMGWPDDHTIGLADSTRYKMCGNGVVKTCAAWISKRIVRFVKR